MTEQTAVATRQPIDIDFSNGIVPRSYAEAMQMSALLHKSGLAPKTLDSLEKIAIAVFMCIELGRPIATGIQDLAVINGKCTIYGDAALALVRASGLLDKFKEWESGTPYTPEWTFHCMMKRKGDEAATGTWSWADSIKAGHDKIGPPSPWAKYTRRMMQFKARNFIMRDQFGDVLKGIKTQEEAYDSIDLEHAENGSWEYPGAAQTEKPREQGVKGPDPSPSFDDVITKPSGLPAKVVAEFLDLTAKGNGMTVEAVKTEAMKESKGFLQALNKWAMQPEEGPRENPDTPAQEQAEEEPETDPIRAEFVNLKTSGYSTWFHKNKGRIATFSDDLQKEIREKWERMYPDAPYPLDANEAAAGNGDPSENGNGISKVWCPDHDSWKPIPVCEKCGKAEKCQKFQEWRYESTGGEQS